MTQTLICARLCLYSHKTLTGQGHSDMQCLTIRSSHVTIITETVENFICKCINWACVFETFRWRIPVMWSRIRETHFTNVNSCLQAEQKRCFLSFSFCVFQHGAVVSDRQVAYYERLCAPRCIHHAEDAVSEVAGQLKVVLAQVTFVKPLEELWLYVCVRLSVSLCVRGYQFLCMHITVTIPCVRDII